MKKESGTRQVGGMAQQGKLLANVMPELTHAICPLTHTRVILKKKSTAEVNKQECRKQCNR